MTIKYNNVYINNKFSIAGSYESKGPLSKYFDKKYDDMYLKEKTIEKAEVRFLKESISALINIQGRPNLIISGDLQNQICSSNYAVREIDIPFIGIYSACATMGEGIGIASNFIESKKFDSIIVSTSSHNMVSEKQFRNPNEYGTLKPDTSTFTATGAVSIFLSSKKSKIRVSSVTFGKVKDLGVGDANNMGAVMAPAACDTLYNHLKDLKINSDYYDLILTGDLGKVGMKIMISYMKKVYNIDISKNYNDCGVMLYDLEKQPVYSGGSGPVCSALVVFSYIYDLMIKGDLKRVLVLPTGALFSPVNVLQKDSIPSISHAFSLEVCDDIS